MAATFEKANTYVYAALIIRDREVGGSNPLAPTTFAKEIEHKGHSRGWLLAFCAASCAKRFGLSDLVGSH